ncbi:DUF6171 family protein [Leptospira langatensis]|uniref:DUF6171 family protein n=1 Tax=Leptospira langatensis TaxID=2484983 RepID=UPI003CCC5BC7
MQYLSCSKLVYKIQSLQISIFELGFGERIYRPGSILELILEQSVENKTFSEKRMGICLDCELLWKAIPTMEQCSVCLCFVRLKTKVQSQSCPMGKW